MATRILNKNNAGRSAGGGRNVHSTSAVSRKYKRTKDGRIIKGIDYTFLVTIVIMLCFGLVMVLSSSSVDGSEKFASSYYFFIKQLRAVVIGLVLMIAVSRFDYRDFKPMTKLFLWGCIGLLVMVLIFGSEFNGAKRWIFGIQPSEFVKLAVAMYFAALIENKKGQIEKFRDLKEFIIIIAAIGLLMWLQPHLSGLLIILAIAAVLLFAGGIHYKWIMSCGALGLAGITAFIISSPNKVARIASFMDPFADAQNMGYQVVQSLYAISTGSFWGLGLGQSRQKYYIPEPYNDFIFAIICEELGTFGALLVIGLFAWFIIRGIKIALEAPDMFGTLTVMGIVTQVAVQAIFNIAVATSSVPNTGISLPFFSYGGSAIMILLIEMGVVLSVSRYSRKNDAM